MTCSAVNINPLLGAVVGLDCFADAVDAVRVERDGWTVEGFGPFEGATLFAFFRCDTVGCGMNLGAEGGEGFGRRVTDVQGEKDVTGAGVDAAW